MEEDYEPTVQHQRRVNPKIHDVIQKEVEKLLDAGLIYPISDSPWVSLVHCVPKKGGMTVATNDENELVPTRLVTGWRHADLVYAMHRHVQKGVETMAIPSMASEIEKDNEVFMDDFSIHQRLFKDLSTHDPYLREKRSFQLLGRLHSI
ncbi:hypothetical protein Tco_0512176 [Tanacetum coccineum]